MIYMASTSNNAGVTLYGDYYDLNNLYDTISIISECKVCKHIKGLNDYILALCYEIRHAYQRMREIKKLGFDKYDKATYYGINVFWPMIIFQVKILRWLAAFVLV